MTKIIAHRGWSSRAPENTLPAFTLAKDEPAIDGIEIDLHMTKDAEFVIIHDYYVDRTSDGSGWVHEKNLSELKELDYGSWFSEEYKATSIMTLKELFDFIEGDKNLILEIKNFAYASGIEKFAKLLNTYRYPEKLYVKSPNHILVQELKKRTEIKTGLLIVNNPSLMTALVESCHADFVSVLYKLLSQELVTELLENDIEVMAWTIDEKEEIDKVKALSNEIMIITNYPERAIDI